MTATISNATRAIMNACSYEYGREDVEIISNVVIISFASANMAVAHTDKVRAICADADVTATVRANEAQATIHITDCSYDVGDE